MNFKEFTTILREAKFREAPSPALLKQIKKIAQLYYSQYNSKSTDLTKLIDNKKIVSFEKNKYYKEYFNHFKINMPTYFTPQNKPLGKVKLLDLETQKEKEITVFCVYGDIGEEYAAYSENFETINLYDKNLKDLSLRMVESKLLHEITHGFQQYKGVSSRYKAASDSEEPLSAELYYKEPIEYDTHLNEVIYNIREKYKDILDEIKKAKDPATKKMLEIRLKDVFLKQLALLIVSPFDSYIDLEELFLPDYVQEFENFLYTIAPQRNNQKDDNRLWKKLKNKLVNYYIELTGKDPRGREVKEDELAKKVK